MSLINFQGLKWDQLRKEYLNFGWTSDTNIFMADVQGSDILSNLAKLLLVKKGHNLGIHLPNAGDDNHSCHILTFFKN